MVDISQDSHNMTNTSILKSLTGVEDTAGEMYDNMIDAGGKGKQLVLHKSYSLR